MKNFIQRTVLALTLFLIVAIAANAGTTNPTGKQYTGNGAKIATSTGSLTSGNCVKIDANGNLVDNGAVCGVAAGNVTTTGTPASGNLSKFSGATTITNGDLSGDVTTSGTLAATIANLAVTNAKIANSTIDLTTKVTGQLPLANGGTAANLTDPNADRIMFWDDSAGAITWLTPGTGLTITGTQLDVSAASGIDLALVTQSTAITLDSATHKGKTVELTGSTNRTWAFTAAATLGSSWSAILVNSSTAELTLDPNGAETIDGLTSFKMYPQEVRLVVCNGSAFFSYVLRPYYLTVAYAASPFKWTEPPGYKETCVRLGAGGGSGGKGNTAPGGGGGGGDSVESCIPTSTTGATETVTIGAGGASQATVNTDGNVGGNTTFGSYVTAYGGAGGGDGNANGGGGGGGRQSAGNVGGGNPASNTVDLVAAGATAGYGGLPGGGVPINATSAGSNAFNPDGGAAGGAQIGGSGCACNGGNGVNGGGGGGTGGTTTAAGGNGGTSVWGGGGGAGGAQDNAPGPGTGGTSNRGGNGGNGGYDAVAGTDGAAGTNGGGGGGGGGTESANSQAGGNGSAALWGKI